MKYTYLGMSESIVTPMEVSDDIKSEAIEDQRILMEMWNWYKSNSEKLTSFMTTFDQVILLIFI